MQPNNQLYSQLADQLKSLDYSDYLDDEDEVLYPDNDPLLINDKKYIPKEDKLRLYTKDEFKIFLGKLMKEKYNKQPKMKPKYLEKVYRKMYEIHINGNKTIRPYEKILYHPDITKTDHEYLTNKLKQWNDRTFYTGVGIYAALIFSYYKTRLGDKMRNNLAMTAVLFGAMPVITLQTVLFFNKYLLDRKTKILGLDEKYNVRQADGLYCIMDIYMKLVQFILGCVISNILYIQV